MHMKQWKDVPIFLNKKNERELHIFISQSDFRAFHTALNPGLSSF